MRYDHKDSAWIIQFYGNCNRVYAGRREEFINAKQGSERQKELSELLDIDAQDIKDLETVLISRGLLNAHSQIF